MKKLLSLLLALSIVATCFVFAPVASADEVTDPYAITVPDTWELVGEESFMREPVENEDGTTTSQFPLTSGVTTATPTVSDRVDPTTGENVTLDVHSTEWTYEYESDFIIDAMCGQRSRVRWTNPSTNKAENSNLYEDVDTSSDVYVDAEGLHMVMPKSRTSNNVEMKFATPLDISTPNDYYIFLDVKGIKTNNSGLHFRFFNSDDSSYQLASGLSSNNNPFSLTHSLYKEINDSTGNIVNSETMRNQDYSDINGKWHRYIFQISPRANGEIVMREKSFNIQNGEVPTLTPDFWDCAIRVNPNAASTPIGDKIDSINFAASHNAGGAVTPVYKNLKIYKAPAVNSYTTPTVGGDGKALAYTTLMTDAVISTNNYAYTMTMDEAPADCEVISQGWYDYSNPDSPVLLAEGRTIDVPASMKGKLMKAVSVIKQGDVTTTYYPFSGYVRDVMDFFTNSNSNVADTSPYTVKVTYQTADMTKAVTTGNNTATSKLTLEQWQAATEVAITTQVNFNIKTPLDDGLFSYIVAQYDKDGALKLVAKCTPVSPNTNYIQRPYRLGEFTPKQRLDRTLKISTAEANPYQLNIAPGDTFKVFTWRTSATPAAVNKQYHYNYEEMIPVIYNPARTLPFVDVTAPVATVPME